ncbi:putative jasmonic acid carboxyl methyltransferase 2 [Silene latifolia]|uniref:putative jasmonic acid carboxyl methyltransferase 2 n=1 Tax=Silene latifolia TaxID=37657 RepID=UPI003D77135C
MEVEKVFHMKKGVGHTSYARNSLLQRAIITQAGPIIDESTRQVYDTLRPECLMMADMGCSSGPTALLAVSRMIDVIEDASRSINRQFPQFGVFLNDLPGNDFNTLFSMLPSFEQAAEEGNENRLRLCSVSGIPKSFYGRVFPDKFLHFVHCSNCVHWLSQVPSGLVNKNGEALNKGNICIAKTSPPEIYIAYYAQFKRDFTLFLRSRSREIVFGGGMVLVILGSIDSHDPDLVYELFGSTLHDMVLEGLIEEEKLDNFNLPLYSPTVDEVRKLVEVEGSFALNKLETITVDWGVDTSQNLDTQAEFVAKTLRAVIEPLLTIAFGHAVMDDLFLLFETRVKARMAEKRSEYVNIVVSLTKKE